VPPKRPSRTLRGAERNGGRRGGGRRGGGGGTEPAHFAIRRILLRERRTDLGSLLAVVEPAIHLDEANLAETRPARLRILVDDVLELDDRGVEGAAPLVVPAYLVVALGEPLA
jgi:hypothetical protein